ncbi:unnamed protein product [Adineta steineri]|uniref:Uncharacterized protein n=1 Tax=Adineta steineri TaxID=433720 RepID=A0A818WLI7_9BILA|nr:unnamed protein product [Adineta steineri]
MDIDINQCEPINYCSNIDDYRPIQSTLLTRFAIATDSSELWRTTNQDYGAFYYRKIPEYCIPDNLKAKIHRRHNRFQDWISCQNVVSSLKTNPSSNNNNQIIFPSNTNQTVRITHRKKFVPKYNDDDNNQNTFSPCGEDGLITEYIVKKILHKLQSLINPGEYSDVVECAQILVSEILFQEPSLCANEIIDRVVTIMITPPNPCTSSLPFNDNCQIIEKLPLSTTISVSEPSINCNQSISLSNVFKKLTNLEDAISKISNNCIQG